MSITQNAMVLNLNIGLWQGYRLDREASRQVTDAANADSDAARVNKHLVPKSALKAVVAAAGAIRTHFYTNTLPWKDNGDRLLTRVMYFDFMEQHTGLRSRFDDAVSQFLGTDYPAARDQAEFRMGDLFNPDDYPSTDTLRRRFYVNLDVDAVTEAGDFRVQMDKDAVEGIQSAMAEAMQGRLTRAMRDVWDRLAETLGHFHTRMASDDIFRNSTVDNLEKLVDLLPGLNLTNDPELTAIGDEIRARLVGYDPKTLRKDPDMRFEAAGSAKEIMDRMSGYMKAFS